MIKGKDYTFTIYSALLDMTRLQNEITVERMQLLEVVDNLLTEVSQELTSAVHKMHPDSHPASISQTIQDTIENLRAKIKRDA